MVKVPHRNLIFFLNFFEKMLIKLFILFLFVDLLLSISLHKLFLYMFKGFFEKKFLFLFHAPSIFAYFINFLFFRLLFLNFIDFLALHSIVYTQLNIIELMNYFVLNNFFAQKVFNDLVKQIVAYYWFHRLFRTICKFFLF